MKAMHQIVLFLIMFITSSYSSGCYNRFPLKDTVDTVKSLVKLYGITKSDVDADGTEWINLLLPERKDGFELEGIKYYFNDNSLPPEQTFYFNQIQFLSTQAYVLPNDTIKTWRASLPDRTYLLSKISFSCPSRQRVCGLRCCPVTNYIVQELFLDKLGATKKFPDDTVRHGEIVYSLINRNATCEYTFSYYDTMMRRILDGQEMTVYFDCPTGSSCCGLSCTPPPRMEESRQPHTAGLSLTQIKQVSLGGGCAVFFVLFALVTTANYQMHRRKMIQHPSFRKSESQETQTSRCSLEKEAFVHMEEGR